MPPARTAAAAVAVLRTAYGAALLAVPTRVTRNWLGRDRSRAATVVALRGLGAREVVLHGGALAAVLGGGSVRPWMVASIGGDCSDVVATWASRDGLPGGAALKTLAVAGGSAALSAAVVAAVDS